METFERVIGWLENLIWNTPEALPAMVVILLSYGIYITVRLGFIQVTRFKHGLKVVSGHYDDPDDEGDINHFQALSTALSATVGIGNIAGVALAIHYGGPGALFWMWITAILGMAIKFSEVTLAQKFRATNPDGSVSGGPMYYIEKGLGPNWKWLAVAFSVAAAICAFLTGNAVQANTVADVMHSDFQIPVAITGFITASLVAAVILGGIKRIGYVTARLVPFMATIYVLGGLLVLLIHYDQILPSLWMIISYAFTPEAGVLGVGSGAFIFTLSYGVQRGLFSNEAGQGSAPIAHSAAKTDQPVREGVVSLLEPFIDTLIVCSITGLVIVITGAWDMHHPAVVDPASGTISYVVEEVTYPGANSLQTNGTQPQDAQTQGSQPQGSQPQNAQNQGAQPQGSQPQGMQTLHFSNGVPQNGQMLRYEIPVDTLFTDSARTTPFSGEITNIGAQPQLITESGEPLGVVYGGVVENGAPLTSRAFELGLAPLLPGGGYLVTFSVLLFAISTSISWSYYGDRAAQYLFGFRSIFWYRIAFVLMHFFGATVTLTTIWAFGDVMLGLMALFNIIALFALSGVVSQVTRNYFDNTEV